MNAIINNGTLWVAGGTNIKYSADGITWTIVANSPTSINSLVWTGNEWLASCDGSNNLYSSNNAIQWYQNSSLSAHNIYKIAYHQNIIFALSDSTVYYTNNFYTWNSHYDASLSAITDYTFTGTHHTFVSGSYILMTQDLISWTKVIKSSSGSYLTANSCNQGTATISPITVACADSSLNTLLYSLDGKMWHGTGTSVLSKANATEWNGSYWLAVGSSWLAISRDGIRWIKHYDTTLDEGAGIAWNGSYWLVSGTKSGLPVLAKSLNGLTWTLITVSLNAVPYIVWNGYKWIINDGTRVYSSTDAINWTQETISGGDISGASIISYTESSNGPATDAFDVSLSTYWSSASSYDASGIGSEWLQMDLGSAKQINHYAIKSNASTFTLYGSTDASNWNTLDTQAFDVSANNILLTFANTNSYQYYKLLVSQVADNNSALNVYTLGLYASLGNPRPLIVHKSWTSSFSNNGYIQYLGIPSAYLNGRALQSTGPFANSYSYNGQYSIITDASNAYYSTIDFSFNSASTSMSKITSSTHNGTYFIVGGSSLKYAHHVDMGSWYNTVNGDILLGGGTIQMIKSNTGLGFGASPNSLYLSPGEKLSVVAPKYYDQNMDKRGSTFMFSLQ